MIVANLAGVLLLLLATPIYAVDKDADPGLVIKLREANTALDRLGLLSDDRNWVYDFTQDEKYTADPGSVVNANAATFPALTGTGMTMALLTLAPCSMLPLHLHRATNLVVAVSGSTDTWMIQENGARMIHTLLKPGSMTVFPAASMHTMMNNGKQDRATEMSSPC